jgi:ferredoxin
LQLQGHLGRFRASAAGPEGLVDLAPLCPNEDGLFDLVLDFYDEPLLDLEVPPLGYAATAGRSEQLADAVTRISGLLGTVNKPRYYNFEHALCAFDRQGVRGCRRCLDRCPADAITIDTEAASIHVDPYLCQGCGSCTLGCPTGALRYARPRPLVLLREIAGRLALMPTTAVQAEAALDGAPVGLPAPGPRVARPLLIHADGAEPTVLPPEVLALPVPALGAVGAEVWLGALALGAARVVVLAAGFLPPTTRQVIEAEIAGARQQLAAIGEAPERLRLVETIERIDWHGAHSGSPALSLEVLEAARTKRAQANAALRHLAQHADARRALIEAPGAAFGTLRIDAERCTSCMACAGLCPTSALRRRAGALAFVPADCVQCGICAQACPEQAIETVSCFDGDAERAMTEKVLKAAAERFCCIACGAPFAPRSLVEQGIARVAHHPVFQGEGRRLLELCPRCRQRASASALEPR